MFHFIIVFEILKGCEGPGRCVKHVFSTTPVNGHAPEQNPKTEHTKRVYICLFGFDDFELPEMMLRSIPWP